MKFHAYLIKYAEIGLKGKNRYLFEDALVHQIRQALKRTDGEFDVVRVSGRIYVNALTDFDEEETVGLLSRVFGIVGICPMVRIEDHGFDDLAEHLIQYVKEVYPEQDFSFKVVTRRARKNYPMTSMEVSAELGSRLLDAFPGLHVDVHEPEVVLNVEIRERLNIYSQEIKGPGGMPVGSNGKAMLLLSGGIDSPVAGYMVAKRGVKIDAVYFHAPPYTSERAKQKVIDLASIVARYAGPIALHIVNITEPQLYLYEHAPHDQMTILLRRMMMRIAEHFAEKGGSLGLITGESIGQVASQTMQSLAVTNEVVSMPVYRPLIAFDKREIVDLAEKIGTYETSILPYEDCCTIFVAKHPVTKPTLRSIEKSEKKIEEALDPLIEEAVAGTETFWVSPR